jgi:hypothetical protein
MTKFEQLSGLEVLLAVLQPLKINGDDTLSRIGVRLIEGIARLTTPHARYDRASHRLNRQNADHPWEETNG